GKDFDDIHDILALRIVVDTVPDCYSAVGIVHNLWHPLPDEFDDFIANPKPNGYQSLHTVVMCQGVTPLEIQIRTHNIAISMGLALVALPFITWLGMNSGIGTIMAVILGLVIGIKFLPTARASWAKAESKKDEFFFDHRQRDR
ncbi:unnamed protein product, partial [marine sediment metagenome]